MNPHVSFQKLLLPSLQPESKAYPTQIPTDMASVQDALELK